MNQNYVTLNDGGKIPQFGLGVYMIQGDEPTCEACLAALKMGYRHIETAQRDMDNEQALAKRIRRGQNYGGY